MGSSTAPAHAIFRLGVPDTASFPFHIWRRLLARSLRALAKVPAAYVEADGRPLLREAIANHVSFARAVACRPDDVVVTAGTQQAFDLLAQDSGDTGPHDRCGGGSGVSAAARGFRGCRRERLRRCRWIRKV